MFAQVSRLKAELKITNSSGVVKARIALSALARRLPGLPRKLIPIRELTPMTNTFAPITS
jgi:hypothetical protein